MWHLRSLVLGSLVGLKLVAAAGNLEGNVPRNEKSTPNSKPEALTLPIKIINTYDTIRLSLGTPPQPVDLLFDTGSDALWVLDPSCAKNCRSAYNFTRSFYDPHASSTSLSANTSETVDYLGGTIVGNVWSDKLRIQNVSLPLPQRFINVNNSTWSSLAAGGFVGLSFKTNSPGRTSIYDTLFHPSILPDHRTGIYLGKTLSTESNPNPTTNGVVTFGGSEENKYGTALKWANVIPSPMSSEYELWRVPVYGVMTTKNGVNGAVSKSLGVQAGTSAIFDTGATSISAPEAIIDALYKFLGLNYTAIQHGYRPLCSELLALNTSLTLTFDAINITLTTAELSTPGYTEDKYCWPPFIPWKSQNWLIGKNYLKSFYTVWDLGGWNVSVIGDAIPRIGFSYLKDEYRPNLSANP